MNAQGSGLNVIRAKDRKVAWHGEAYGKKVARDAQVFSPPALGAKGMYLCTTAGHLLAISQSDGRRMFLYKCDVPMAFQPAPARGNVHVGSANGMLICLKTGGRDADGWSSWGRNAQHNKK